MRQFQRLIAEWLDSHPNEYADFVEEMNDKTGKHFIGIKSCRKDCERVPTQTREA